MDGVDASWCCAAEDVDSNPYDGFEEVVRVAAVFPEAGIAYFSFSLFFDEL